MIVYTKYSVDARVKRQAEAFAARGDHVDVICLDEPRRALTDRVNLIGIPTARYRGSSRRRYLGSYAAFFSRAAACALKLSRRSPYDVAIVCTLPDLAILSALPLRAFGTRLVLDMHDTMPELYRDKFPGERGEIGARILTLCERLSASLADRVLAVHELHAERLVAAGISAEKIRVVVNSPDPAIFKRRDADERRADGFNLVCHGTVTHRLGLDTALEALAILRRRSAQALHLTVIGDGDHLGELKALARKLGVDSWVTFKEPVPLELLPAELVSATIGLAPYHANAATNLMLPVKLLEYAALGIPTVCARTHTVERYFVENTVEYFEAGNAYGLADAIQRLSGDPLRCRELADRAWRVSVELGWERQRGRLFDAIDSVLADARANACPAAPPEQLPASGGPQPTVVEKPR
jgi:glycosyltransferase involved in cell wall biosynthesis